MGPEFDILFTMIEQLIGHHKWCNLLPQVAHPIAAGTAEAVEAFEVRVSTLSGRGLNHASSPRSSMDGICICKCMVSVGQLWINV